MKERNTPAHSPESPRQFFVGISAAGDVNGHQEFLEVDETVAVFVKGPGNEREREKANLFDLGSYPDS